MARINILKKSDIINFDLPIDLSDEDRKNLFLSEDIKSNNISFRKNVSKIGFLLQLGYFKANKKFYNPTSYNKKDIEYISNLLGIQYKANILDYSKPVSNRHRQKILSIFGYNPFVKFKVDFLLATNLLVKTSLKPKDILYSLIDHLHEKKIEIPKYYIFLNVIGDALNSFESSLIKQIDSILTAAQKNILDNLIKLPSNPDKFSSRNPYLITSLKKPEQGINPKKIKESLEDFYIIEDLHAIFIDVIEEANISKELLNYYAVWLIKVKHIQFDSIANIALKRLHLIAFIIYQYRLRQDLFIDTHLQCVSKYTNESEKIVANQFLNEKVILKEKDRFNKIRNIVESSKDQMLNVKEIIKSENYLDRDKVKLISELLFINQSTYQDKILDELSKIDSTSSKRLKDEMLYGQLSRGFRKIQNRVGNIILILEFNPDTSEQHIIEAINFYKQNKAKISDDAPIEFLSLKDSKWLFKQTGELDKALYKVLLFKAISNHIKAGSLNLKYSDKYKSIDEYLIPKEDWDKNKMEFISRANLNNLHSYEIFLNDSKKQLDTHYRKTNEEMDENKNLKMSRDGKPMINTPKLERVISNGCMDILGVDQYLPLINILSEVKHTTKISESFVHYSRKTFKNELSNNLLYAGIIGLGCNIGVRKMGKISKGIGADKLENVVRWYFSKENLEDANKKILSLINDLSLPKIFSQNINEFHTSSDGQKFNVTVPSLQARYSYKYFGFGKGVSAYSFIDDQNKLFYSTIISAAEREAGYVLDGLMHNEEFESDIHSTDTHGYSEIIFAISNSLGIFFAPRIKNHKDQLIYTFKSNPRKIYEDIGYNLLPSKGKQINEIILQNEWENILRLLCSIKLKESKASEILNRLSSYSKQHPLYRALKELGRIYKSIFFKVLL